MPMRKAARSKVPSLTIGAEGLTSEAAQHHHARNRSPTEFLGEPEYPAGFDPASRRRSIPKMVTRLGAPTLLIRQDSGKIQRNNKGEKLTPRSAARAATAANTARSGPGSPRAGRLHQVSGEMFTELNRIQNVHSMARKKFADMSHIDTPPVSRRKAPGGEGRGEGADSRRGKRLVDAALDGSVDMTILQRFGRTDSQHPLHTMVERLRAMAGQLVSERSRTLSYHDEIASLEVGEHELEDQIAAEERAVGILQRFEAALEAGRFRSTRRELEEELANLEEAHALESSARQESVGEHLESQSALMLARGQIDDMSARIEGQAESIRARDAEIEELKAQLAGAAASAGQQLGAHERALAEVQSELQRMQGLYESEKRARLDAEALAKRKDVEINQLNAQVAEAEANARQRQQAHEQALQRAQMDTQKLRDEHQKALKEARAEAARNQEQQRDAHRQESLRASAAEQKLRQQYEDERDGHEAAKRILAAERAGRAELEARLDAELAAREELQERFARETNRNDALTAMLQALERELRELREGAAEAARIARVGAIRHRALAGLHEQV